MKLFPYEDYVLTTSLPPAEIQRRLLDNVDTEDGYFSALTDASYCGTVGDYSFNIFRPYFHSSLNQQVKGSVLETKTGSRIRVTVEASVSSITILFMIVVFNVVSAIVSAISASNFRTFAEGAGVPLVIFGIVYLVMLVLFNLGSHRSKDFLTNLLDAKIVK